MDMSHLQGERHLDVGCDTGALALAFARLYGTLPTGVDVSRHAILEALRRGLNAHHGAIDTLPDQDSNFHLITAIDLIEHVVDPEALLKEIGRRLRPGGVCYLETPNIESRVYNLGRTFARLTRNTPARIFERLFPDEHIQYFSKTGLKLASARAGLEAVHLSSRSLRPSDIATSAPIGLAVSAIDATSRDRLLLCAVLRRPDR